jgi:hypothetical protein
VESKDNSSRMSVTVLHVPYDFINNGPNELMLVMDALGDEPDEDNVKFIYDGNSEAMLVYNERKIIHLPVIPEPYLEILSNFETILVTEMNGDDIFDVYEARVEIQKGPLPLPKT